MIDGDLSCEARSVETPSSARFAHTPSSFGSHLLSVSSLYFLLDKTIILVKHNHHHHRFVETPSRVTSTVPSLSCILDQRQRQRQDTFFVENPSSFDSHDVTHSHFHRLSSSQTPFFPEKKTLKAYFISLYLLKKGIHRLTKQTIFFSLRPLQYFTKR